MNPAAKVKPPRREKAPIEILNDDELGRVLAVADEPWRLIFDLLSWTALRRGEALAIKWGDLDLQAACIHVRASRGRYGEGAPKSEAGVRVVPITPPMVAALRRHRMAQPPDSAEDGGYVFRSRIGGPLDGDNVTRAWARSLRKAGVRHVALHGLRHLAVSRMISAGANPKVIQTVVGHANVQITLDTYSHMLDGDLDSLAAKLAVSAGDAAGTQAGLAALAN